MGIKRLKKVFVITGAENSGKTRFIKEVARRFYESKFEYIDLMNTIYADFLNREPQKDMNDDIFGYFKTPFDCIGISSAGDLASLIKKMFELLRAFQPDVIILAVRTDYVKDLIDEIKKSDDDFNPEQNTEYSLLNLADDAVSEKNVKESITDSDIDSFVKEVKSAIRGFSYKK